MTALPPVSGSRSLPDFTIVGDLHVHSHLDLARTLGISTDDVTEEGDARLVLAAYSRWGFDCPAHLEGTFSFALWDDLRKCLFLCRDHLGTRPLFYWQRSARFAFASDPLVLLRFPGVSRELNRRKLAALSIPHGWEYHQDETLHSGILSLRPGTSLTVTPDGRAHHRTYWIPAINPDLIPQREADAFDTVRELLFSSVRNQIRGKRVIASKLSGGLDSSAVTAIAARCLAESNRELLAISAVLPQAHVGFLQGESEFTDEFRSWPNIRVQQVTGAGRGPFDYLDRPQDFEACPGLSTRRYLEEALSEEVAAGGADIALDGVLGEAGPTAYGYGHYADLFSSFQWRSLSHELNSFWRVPGRVPRRFGPLRQLAGEFRSLALPYRGWGLGADVCFNTRFIWECEARSLFRRKWKSNRERQLEGLQATLRGHATRHLTVAPTKVDNVYPLFDRRLLEFCLAAPGNMKVRDGYSRYLVRRALDGILPPKIQWRTTKTPFSPDYFFRFNAQLPRARAFLSEIRLNDPVRNVVDVERMQNLLNPVDPLQMNYDALGLPVSFYLICFLRQFSEFRP